jgi:fructose-specific phosphotransferase system IIC component
MKKKSIIIEALIIIIGPIGGYIGYYDNITCKPTQAGFWFIIVIGISIGVVITQVVQWINDKKKKRVVISTTTDQNVKK